MACGSILAGGTLGILIPPSVVLIIYAIIVEANVVTMFMAALIPGLIAVLFFILTILIYVLIWPDAGPRGEAASREEFISATLNVLPVGLVFAVVIGGIYLGFFNPTPAAAVGAEVLQSSVGQRRDRLAEKPVLHRRLRHYRPLASKSMRGSMMVYMMSPTSVITSPSSEKKNSVPKMTG